MYEPNILHVLSVVKVLQGFESSDFQNLFTSDSCIVHALFKQFFKKK